MSQHYLAKLLLRAFSKLLMMFVGVTKFGKMNSIFVAVVVNMSDFCYFLIFYIS